MNFGHVARFQNLGGIAQKLRFGILIDVVFGKVVCCERHWQGCAM